METMPFVTKSMNLESTILSEIKLDGERLYDLTYVQSKKVNSHKQSKLVVARG